MSVFLDTNVLFYAAARGLAVTDHTKRPVARDLLSADFMLSAQVLTGFYATITRKGPAPFSHAEASDFIDLLRVQPCVPVDAELVQAGAAIAERFRISYWDGAILAAAHIGGADILYSEDLSDGQRYGSVRVVNPFAG